VTVPFLGFVCLHRAVLFFMLAMPEAEELGQLRHTNDGVLNRAIAT
jgi:hypothetical protein